MVLPPDMFNQLLSPSWPQPERARQCSTIEIFNPCQPASATLPQISRVSRTERVPTSLHCVISGVSSSLLPRVPRKRLGNCFWPWLCRSWQKPPSSRITSVPSTLQTDTPHHEQKLVHTLPARGPRASASMQVTVLVTFFHETPDKSHIQMEVLVWVHCLTVCTTAGHIVSMSRK